MRFNFQNSFLTLSCLLLGLFSMAQESKFITINEGLIHYKTFGKGKPILIINGGPGMNSDGFDAIAREIANKGFQTIIYDQRGTGKSVLSKVDSTTITMDLMVEDIETLRKHLKIKKWSVFGQSFGGMLATKYAYQHQDKIDKIIFSSSAGVNLKFLEYINQRLNGNLTKIEQDSLSHYSLEFDNHPENEEILFKRACFLASAYVYQKKFIPQLAKRLTQVNYPVNELVLNDLIKNKFDFSENFKPFQNPVIIFQGENDVISVETAQSINITFPNSKLIVLSQCGHYPWLDQPDLFFQDLVTFLKS